jgi:cytochrome c-type biogenesis protein CcmH/NrfF
MLTAREQQLWDDLVARYGTDAAAEPPERGGAA